MTEKQRNMTKYIKNTLEIDVYDCPRVRSWEMSLDKPILEVRGRFGGGNRDDYEESIEEFQRKYNVVNNRDDDVDCTHGYFVIELEESKWIKFKDLYETEDNQIS